MPPFIIMVMVRYTKKQLLMYVSYMACLQGLFAYFIKKLYLFFCTALNSFIPVSRPSFIFSLITDCYDFLIIRQLFHYYR